MEAQNNSLSPAFFKLLLNFVSLITCFLTFYNTSDVTSFTSTSILFLANNIISCVENPFNNKIVKFIGGLFVKFEVIVIAVLFVINPTLDKHNNIDLMILLKYGISFIMFFGFIFVAYLKGQNDTPQDKHAREVAQKVTRESNDKYLTDMRERKNHYVLKNRSYIANTSFKKSGRRK